MDILFYGALRASNLQSREVHIYEVLTGLSKLGHNVVLLNSGFPSDTTEVGTVQYLSVWKRIKDMISQSRILKLVMGEIALVWLFLNEIRIFISAFIILARRRGKFDLIYRRHNVFSSEYLLAKLFGIPSVKEVNGILVDERRIRREADKISLWIIDNIERFSMPRADKIIVVTSSLKEILQKYYRVPGEKIVVVMNGANTDVFKPMDVINAREELGLAQNRNYICFVGILEPWQGVEYAIKSLPLIIDRCPEARLLIVGDGSMKQELVKQVEQVGMSDRVVFTGMVPYQEVPLYMNAGDVCISPKAGLKSGYSPLKLCEYLACEKPVVASRASGLEIVEDSGGGILVEPGDAAAMAAVIIKLLQNPELRKQMGKKGRLYVVRNRNWESVAKRVADVCQSLVNSRRDGDTR